MSNPEPIIDVNPVEAAREKGGAATGASAGTGYRAPAYDRTVAGMAKDAAAKASEVYNQATQATPASVIDGSGAAAQKANPVAGAVQTVAGGVLMLVGIPMLILPGPGIAAIAGGAAIAAGGIKKLRRK